MLRAPDRASARWRCATGPRPLALEDAEVVLVSTSDPASLAALQTARPRLVIDLDGRLGAAVEHIAGYSGVSW